MWNSCQMTIGKTHFSPFHIESTDMDPLNKSGGQVQSKLGVWSVEPRSQKSHPADCVSMQIHDRG